MSSRMIKRFTTSAALVAFALALLASGAARADAAADHYNLAV